VTEVNGAYFYPYFEKNADNMLFLFFALDSADMPPWSDNQHIDNVDQLCQIPFTKSFFIMKAIIIRSI